MTDVTEALVSIRPAAVTSGALGPRRYGVTANHTEPVTDDVDGTAAPGPTTRWGQVAA